MHTPDATLAPEPNDFLGRLACAAGAWSRLCLQRRRDRRALLDLNRHQLRDIGVTPADVERETRRWAWDGKPR